MLSYKDAIFATGSEVIRRIVKDEGHFHNSWHSEIGGVWYKMLDIMELLEVPRIIPDGV